MNISDVSYINVGSNAATCAYIGATLVWPALASPYYLDYSSTLGGGWGNHIADGDNLSLSGSYYFAAFNDTNNNITSQYDWTISGDVTLTSIEYVTGNPYTTIQAYKYTFGGGSATLQVSDPNNPNRIFYTVTFN